ncbi:B- and T-lymphocyte attenuator isoform X1 [Theropithecus gelada]|uniref:B- and T-lymphocyte attenuator n=1 Tax=Theropithecus gelada TaxID=9565 RepID=A0A8D2E8Q1_THEGE|nr:B- and T-lymphocyte attenuator isoform X1 [Theropithecus gelada]
MKTLPAMLGSGRLFWVVFLIPYLDIWNIHGKESCDVQLYIKRQSYHSIFAGDPFKLECPVKYCAHRPHVTWCKLNGTTCVKLEGRHTSWKQEKNLSFFILHFEPVLPSDNGSYRCSADFLSAIIESHSTTLYVTDVKSASERPSKDEMASRPWLLYSLLPLGGLPLLITTCFCLFCFLRRHQGKQNELSDTTGREITLVDVPFKSEQTEARTRQNSQVLLSETGIYDNEPDFCFRMQEGSEGYSNPCLEENKPGIIYASLNHSIIGLNSRQARNVKEAPTEYASICVRS